MSSNAPAKYVKLSDALYDYVVQQRSRAHDLGLEEAMSPSVTRSAIQMVGNRFVSLVRGTARPNQWSNRI